MAKFDPNHKGAKNLKDCVHWPTYNDAWPLEYIIVYFMYKERLHAWTVSELGDKFYGQKNLFFDKIQAAVGVLQDLNIIEVANPEMVTNTRYRLTTGFLMFADTPDAEEPPILEFSLKVQGQQVSAEDLRIFKKHAGYILEVYREVEVFRVGRVTIDKETAKKLLEKLDGVEFI